MPLTLGRNISAVRAERLLSSVTGEVSDVYVRLSSGRRINSPSDDVAGLSVSASLSLSARVYSQGVRNLNQGISALNVAESALTSLSSLVSRGRELATQAANGTYSAQQRAALQVEMTSMVHQ